MITLFIGVYTLDYSQLLEICVVFYSSFTDVNTLGSRINYNFLTFLFLYEVCESILSFNYKF